LTAEAHSYPRITGTFCGRTKFISVSYQEGSRSMNRVVIAIVMLVSLPMTVLAETKQTPPPGPGQSEFAPGQKAKKPGEAKKFAPGQQ